MKINQAQRSVVSRAQQYYPQGYPQPVDIFPRALGGCAVSFGSYLQNWPQRFLEVPPENRGIFE